MRYFFDTEFIEDGKTIELISIGIVGEDGSNYYAQNLDCDLSRASDWVKENVISCLDDLDARGLNNKAFWTDPIRSNPEHHSWRTKAEIRQEILEFVGSEPKFWAYYADYDWVVFCQLFGLMIDLPSHWPMFCRDLKQLVNSIELPSLKDSMFFPANIQEHNALADAEWAANVYNTIMKLKGSALIPVWVLGQA